jgi:branched-chain amino acid transport system substrate-binding protein
MGTPRLASLPLVALLLAAAPVAVPRSGATGPAAPAAASAGPAAPSAPETGRRLPAGRAGELKALLLERSASPSAGAWAAEYAGLPEVERMEPVTRAAERLWAARIGLAADPAGAERKKLRLFLAQVEGCPLDSIAIRRAATGLTRIGVVVPLTGRYSRYGRTFVNGLRLAADEHNRAWSPTLTLVLHDSEGDPLIGARKARWLLRDHGVSVLVGELFSANTAPLAAATQVVGAVLLSPSATNERLATLGEGVFQLYVADGVLASALAGSVLEATPKASLAILAGGAPEDSIRAAILAGACRAAGVTVVGVERVPEAAVDFTAALTALRAKHPSALALLGPPRVVSTAAAQLPAVWRDARVYGFESLDPEALNPEARDALEGATFFAPDYVLEGAPRDSFEARYTRAFGAPPTRMSVRGYLVGLALTRAVEGGSVNAAMLREALRAQLYETEEGRTLRALKPLLAATPERFVIRKGRAVPPGASGQSP